jgi:hypothetical protein
MRLKYGNFVFDDAECLITYNGAQRVYGPRGIATGLLRTWVVEGEIVASGQTAIETRRTNIETALSSEGGRASLLDNDGFETYVMDSADGKGVKVLELAWLQEEAKAHFATALPFRIRLQQEEFLSDQDPLLFYNESVSRIGNGGPREVFIELQNGPPVRQITATHTPITIIQRGERVYEFFQNATYPPFNAPIFPQNLLNPEEATEYVSPEQDGTILVRPTARWNYVMVFNTVQALPFPNF